MILVYLDEAEVRLILLGNESRLIPSEAEHHVHFDLLLLQVHPGDPLQVEVEGDVGGLVQLEEGVDSLVVVVGNLVGALHAAVQVRCRNWEPGQLPELRADQAGEEEQGEGGDKILHPHPSAGFCLLNSLFLTIYNLICPIFLSISHLFSFYFRHILQLYFSNTLHTRYL